MSARLKVLQLGKFYWPHRGGIETYLQSLCERIQDRVDLQVLVANDLRTSGQSTVNRIQIRRAGTLFRFASAPICPTMAAMLRNTKADIVHIHLPNPWAVLAYLQSGHQGRLIVSYHSDVVRQQFLATLFEPILRRAMDKAAAVIATSPDYVESSPCLRRYRDRCHVIPYGIAPELYEKPDLRAVSNIRQRYGSRLILTVGRLVYYKGLDCLIAAMQQIDGTLLIVGEGPLRAALEAQAQRQGVIDRVVFLGRVEDTTPFYAAADVFVLASNARSEAFGIVQLEAMACGKPVVNTALRSGVPFVSIGGETGLTVPPNDSSALAVALNVLLNSEALRSRYGDAARARVRAKFNVDSMADDIVKLYEMACPKRTREKVLSPLIAKAAGAAP